MQVYPDDDYIGVEEKENTSVEIEKRFNFTPVILLTVAALVYLVAIKRK